MFDINEVVDYLNQNYNQQREEDIPNIDVYDKETIIAFWGCGAFVLHQDIITDIYEDDGHWFADTGYSNHYNKDWIDSKIAAYSHLKDYLKEHGYPEYSVIHINEFGEKEQRDKDICGYSFFDKKESPYQKYTSLRFFDIELKECGVKFKTNAVRFKREDEINVMVYTIVSVIGLTSYKDKILNKNKYTISIHPDGDEYTHVFKDCEMLNVEKYNEEYSRYMFKIPYVHIQKLLNNIDYGN